MVIHLGSRKRNCLADLAGNSRNDVDVITAICAVRQLSALESDCSNEVFAAKGTNAVTVKYVI